MKKLLQKIKLKSKGYMLAIATIMVSVILIISSSISFILMREINRVNVPISSQIAYNYADTAMRCLSSLNDITILSDNKSDNDSNANFNQGVGLFDYGSTGYYAFGDYNDPPLQFYVSSLKCLDNAFLNQKQFRKDIKENSNVVDVNKVNAPREFFGGVKYDVTVDVIDNNNTGFNGCVRFEIYSTTTSITKNNQEIEKSPKKLFVATGKVPCKGGVERIITKSY